MSTTPDHLNRPAVSMIGHRIPITEERASSLGLGRMSRPLSPHAAGVVSAVIRWHEQAGPDEWIEPYGAPLAEWSASSRRFVPLVRSLGSGTDDYTFGEELAIGAFKTVRPFPGDSAWYCGERETVFSSVVEIFDDEESMSLIRAGFSEYTSMMLACALAGRSPFRAALARLDAIDHAEAAARLACLLHGFVPPCLFSTRERFPLLSRPHSWVDWVGDRP